MIIKFQVSGFWMEQVTDMIDQYSNTTEFFLKKGKTALNAAEGTKRK